jgi:hypothetical protein
MKLMGFTLGLLDFTKRLILNTIHANLEKNMYHKIPQLKKLLSKKVQV